MKLSLRKILGIAFIIAAFICLYFAFVQQQKYVKGNAEYKQVEKKTKEIPENNKDISPEFQVDWNSLRTENPDIVGWIKMDPSVNYPIVQTTDNKYYLKHGFRKSYNINGCIFMHSDNKSDWTDPNTIIYGHNMLNGSMFGNNKLYKSKEYTKKHPYFYIYTPDYKMIYKIFDVMTVNDASTPYQITMDTEEDFQKYIDTLEHLASYKMDVTVTTKDHIVTLSTCTNHGKQRFLIQGVLTDLEKNKK